MICDRLPGAMPVRRRRGPLALAAAFTGALTAALAVVVPVAAEEWFRDVATEAGVDFLHRDGRSGLKHYVETTASGGGWLDFDGDGDLDLYLLAGAATPGSKLASTPRNALYENRGAGGRPRFADVAERAGVDDRGYGMGLCAGDVDADGRLDFMVTNYGADRLYRNLGDGRFEEIATAAGIAGEHWSIGCAFGDLDGDGDLDLYVSHYLDFAFDRDRPRCHDPATGRRLYCRPIEFDGVADSLFVNQGATGGGVRFREEGRVRGIDQGATNRGMGVILSDLDLDGDLDIYVANDGALNRLYANAGKGFFEDLSLASGAGLNASGMPEAGMGVAAGDVDGDGRPDLYVSHFAMETNTLYRGSGNLQFDDVTARAGLGPPSYKQVGWGVALLDADNDGDLDLAVANGHMQEGVEQLEPGLRYAQPNQLLENLGGGRFRDAGGKAGAAFDVAGVSRGLAVGDWNDDGRLDLLITNTNAGVDLLENRVDAGGGWLGLELRGPPANPFAIGARVELTAGGKRQQREVASGGGFQSQGDLRLHFGLGDHRGPVRVEVHWPGGDRQLETIGELDRYWRIRYRKP